jgi:hypothetical protein
MAGFVQQLPALLGVIVGVLASYLAGTVAERGRWRRQQEVRWDERRIAAYTEYAHAVKKVIAVSVRLAAQRGIYPDDDVISPEYRIADLGVAEDERTIKWEAVLMLGSDLVVVAGRDWHQSVFRLMRLACGQTSDMTWQEAVDATGRARQRFYEAAKGDIGIAIGRTTDAYEWQMGRSLSERPEGVALASPDAGSVTTDPR